MTFIGAVLWGLVLGSASIVVPEIGGIFRFSDGSQVEGKLKDSSSYRLAVTSRDELGELASAFNDMAEHLTEFRRSNQGEVLQAKAALEATLQALPESVILLDDDRRVLSMNRRAQDLLGVAGSPDGLRARALEVGGVPLEALVAGEGPHSRPDAMDLARALRVTLNGTERRLLARSLPVSDLSDAGQRTILVLYDVTELARLDEMRAELIAVASHELRTPLTTLWSCPGFVDTHAGLR
jgi:NtrC-family two-component system sensor histidine kinase KinB